MNILLLQMVLKGGKSSDGASKIEGGGNGKEERPIYYKEINEGKRISRFCLKPVESIQPRGEKKAESINVQVVKGKTTTFIHLDEDEAKKVSVQLDDGGVLDEFMQL